MNGGWVKIYRNLLDKPIWLESSPAQKTILITLLLMANSKPRQWEWHGEPYTTKPGQFVTSLKGIMEKAGLGVTSQNVRTALKRFEKYGFLTSKSTNKNRLITIENWEKYQSKTEPANKPTNKQLTSNQQAANKQLTTNKNLRTKELKKKRVKDNVQEAEPDQFEGQVHEVIDYLNSKTGKKFQLSSKDNRKIITARLREGVKVASLKYVIDVKTAEWLKDPDMNKFLRPSTLFTAKHVEEYSNESMPQPVSIVGRRGGFQSSTVNDSFDDDDLPF